MSLAPYQVHIVQIGSEPAVIQAVAKLEIELEATGIEILIDDRAERPGVKFKDADLIGIPLRLTIGQRSLEKGGIELKWRNQNDPKQASLVALDQAAAHIADLLRLVIPQLS